MSSLIHATIWWRVDFNISVYTSLNSTSNCMGVDFNISDYTRLNHSINWWLLDLNISIYTHLTHTIYLLLGVQLI